MMHNNHIFILIISLIYITGSYAAKDWKTQLHIPNGDAYLTGCQNALQLLKFGYTPPNISENGGGSRSRNIAKGYQSICNYTPATGTLLLCVDKLVGEDGGDLQSIMESLSEKCDSYAQFYKPSSYYYYQLANASVMYMDSDEALNSSATMYQPAYPNMTTARLVYNAYYSFYLNLDNSTYFGLGLLLYFLVVMLISMFFNFLTKCGLIKLFTARFFCYFRSYVTIPAVIPEGRHAQPWGALKIFTGLFPDRLESVICLGYIILHIVFWCYPYYVSETHSIIWKSSEKELQKLLGDRAGIMAFSELPLLVLFAGRNNILIGLTDFKYSSFIHFHKVIARIMFLGAFIHAVAYTKYIGSGASKETYFKCGITGFTFAGALWILSSHSIRSRWYECFLYSHIIMVIIFLSMCWYHCRSFGSGEWLIGSCIFWFLDRVIRILRMCLFGFQSAELTFINRNTFKISVKRPRTYISGPCQYGFLYFADWKLFFQNHPFSTFNKGDRLIMYVRVKDGITRRVYNELVCAGGRMNKKVCLEGPYGSVPPIGKYHNTLLITAGAGIPGIFELALHLSENPLPERIKLIWIHKTLSDLQFYLDDLLVKLKKTRIVIDIFLTRERPLKSCDFSSISVQEWSKVSCIKTPEDLPSFINVKMGRPDMGTLLSSELDEFFDGGSIGIVACGPAPMMDDLKHAVSKEVLSYQDRIDYFDEFQTW